ncbi:MAG: hypothetical protein DIJKHBIC_04010 [Thermoanaerobaculia bacterium]|nr:hypothetical protein [Thermoanaerobaculia bacterium]
MLLSSAPKKAMAALPNLEPLRSLLLSPDVKMTTLRDGSGVLLNLRGGEVLTMNETGMFLVNRLREGVTGAEELVALLEKEFEVEPGVAERDLAVFASQLSTALSRVAPPPFPPSRR